MSIRERLDTLSRGELAGLGVVLVVTLAGAGLWYTRSLPKPVTIAETPGAGAALIAATPAPGSVAAVASGSLATLAPSGAGSVSPAGAPVIVDVTGLVRNPGVYEFPAGSRVIDAVERAGGAKEGADLSLLNLAAPLADGQQIVVPKEGAAPSGVAPSSVPGSVSGSTGAPININTASAVELEELSGIGEVLAAAVVAYRDEHGPFTAVDQLEDVSGIGPATLEEIRDQVSV